MVAPAVPEYGMEYISLTMADSNMTLGLLRRSSTSRLMPEPNPFLPCESSGRLTWYIS